MTTSNPIRRSSLTSRRTKVEGFTAEAETNCRTVDPLPIVLFLYFIECGGLFYPLTKSHFGLPPGRRAELRQVRHVITCFHKVAIRRPRHFANFRVRNTFRNSLRHISKSRAHA